MEGRSLVVTQTQIARQVGIDVSSVNKILNRHGEQGFSKATVKKVYQAAQRLGFDFDRLKHAHRREYERRAVDWSAGIAIYAADGTLLDEGSCHVSDIARCGASLTDVRVKRGSMPLRPFSVGLRIDRKSGGQEEILGRVVRLQEWDGTLKLGIAFDVPGFGRD